MIPCSPLSGLEWANHPRGAVSGEDDAVIRTYSTRRPHAAWKAVYTADTRQTGGE